MLFTHHILKVPVSYTHLDVYKRQVYGNPYSNCPNLESIEVIEGNANLKAVDGAVSYTHLKM